MLHSMFMISPFDVGDDSRTNPFEERGDDATHQIEQAISSALSGPLLIPSGPIARA